MSAHYDQDGFETIDFIEEVLNLGDFKGEQAYLVGNAIKYAQRAGKKGPWHRDAYKCADYLTRIASGNWIGVKREEGRKHKCVGCKMYGCVYSKQCFECMNGSNWEAKTSEVPDGKVS